MDWRHISLWLFPLLAFPDMVRNVSIFNLGLIRKKRFDASLLLLLILRSDHHRVSILHGPILMVIEHEIKFVSNNGVRLCC